MKLYLLSPQGVPPNPHLFPMFIDEWQRKGVQIVSSIENCDVVLFDLHSRIADYKEYDIDYILRNDLPIAVFDEWDRGNMSKDEWPYPLTKQQEEVWLYSHTIKSVSFSRLLDKTKNYPFNLYPLDKPILYEEPLLTSDELFNREFDVVFIANHSPSRQAISETLQQDIKLKTFISIGAKKRPFNDFVNWHKRGKLFISSGAGGYTDERKQNLFSIAGLIQEETDQLTHHQWVHGYDCLKISSPPTKEELDTIYAIANDKELLYSIYLRCYNSMKEHYSASYLANYVLEKIKEHLG